VVEHYANRRVKHCSPFGIVPSAKRSMKKESPHEISIAYPAEVVVIGNPEAKPKRALPFHLPSGGETRRQAKARARLEKIMQNPNLPDDVPPGSAFPKPKLKRGQQKRADYRKRQLRQAGKEAENIDSK
jgi:hypothetical protein